MTKYENKVARIGSWISGKPTDFSKTDKGFAKINPADNKKICEVIPASKENIKESLRVAHEAFGSWRDLGICARAKKLAQVCELLNVHRNELGKLLHEECGKPMKHALAEVDAAIACGTYFSNLDKVELGFELISANPMKRAFMRREAIGPGLLITSFNNPLAGIIWKLFPALIMGNTVVVKAHEFAPRAPIALARILKEAGIGDGVYSFLQGGPEVGAALIEGDFKFISFTGSYRTGVQILKVAAPRFVKVSIESGGKNPFIVSDDADLDRACEFAVQGVVADAGQRCAATSRIIVMEKVYDQFREKFLERIKKIKVGLSDQDDYGAIISRERLQAIKNSISEALRRNKKAKVITENHEKNFSGNFMEPIAIEGIPMSDALAQEELFGPVVLFFKAKDFDEAIALANNSFYKLTGAIHTKNIDRAESFVRKYEAGVARVNGATHGSEPHFPFGGVGRSGNGFREPGILALDFYSEWKQITYEHQI